MAKEGYLIFHEGMEGRRTSHIYYCVLGEGRLQLFSKRDSGVLVRDVQLTKSKLKIRGVPDHEALHCPFSFTVVVHHSKIVDGRQIVYGKPSTLLISAPSWVERKSWGNAIHSWQRNYWGEPEHRISIKDDNDIEAFFEDQRRTLESAIQRAASGPSGTGSTTPTQASTSSSSSTGRRSFFSRAPSIKKMGSNMRKKIRSASVTISLPPMSINITSSLQQLRPQQQQMQPQAATAH